MKKNIIILGIIILSVIFQTSILPLCFSQKNIPDLILVVFISATAVFGFISVWVWVIIAGFILDIFTFRKVGINIISFIVFSYFVSFFSRRLILGEKISGILAGTVFIAIATFFHNLWIYLSSYNLKIQEIWLIKSSFFTNIGWKIIFNLVLFFLTLLIFKQIEKKYSPQNKLLAQR